MTDMHSKDAAEPALAGTTAVVTGASRGFGRAIAVALAGAGVRVVGVARSTDLLHDVRAQLGDRFVPFVADATDPDVSVEALANYRPRTLVLSAGAATINLPLQEQSGESFNRNWDVDVRHVFEWTRAALWQPLDPGSRVVSISSGAALRGSPVSGGYAGAKATVRFLSNYAADESDRAGLRIGFATLLPQLTPATGFGSAAVAAYANRQGTDLDAFTAGLGSTLSADDVAAAVVDLCQPGTGNGESFLLTTAGLTPVGS